VALTKSYPSLPHHQKTPKETTFWSWIPDPHISPSFPAAADAHGPSSGNVTVHGLSTAGHQTYHGLSSAQRGLAEYSVDAKRRAREVADALRSPDWRQVPERSGW